MAKVKLLAIFSLVILAVGPIRHAFAEDDIDDTPIKNDEFKDFGDEGANVKDDDEGMAGGDEPPLTEAEASVDPIDFQTPEGPSGAYFSDAFPTSSGIGSKWIVSEAKKDGVDEGIAKYNGIWQISTPDKVLLTGDQALILTTKARHAAIATKLARPFNFNAGKPLVVQYDVKFQNGQECGGAYIKLLEKDPNLNLKQYTDKTPYSIMFGPDKCGMTTKVHAIFRVRNPVNGTTNEHHAAQPESASQLDEYIADHKSHLYRLVVEPSGTFRVSVDQKQIMSGSLGTEGDDLLPNIVQPKEIPDPAEKKPADWDEREKIPDPDATKPEDWDEDAPEKIEDADAVKPDDWLEEEEALIPDPSAEKPADWDAEMDGEWEAPKIANPKCEGISGCGEWTRPQIKNPAYKGKWRAPQIKNPDYQGKWKPRQIPNPSFFEAAQPFQLLTPIGAIGLELWTMSEGIAFDNFLVTDSLADADDFAAASWGPKSAQENREARKSTFFGGLMEAANERPWMWAVYLLVVLIPIVLITVCCCAGGGKDETAEKKKTDAVTADDDESTRPNSSRRPPPPPRTTLRTRMRRRKRRKRKKKRKNPSRNPPQQGAIFVSARRTNNYTNSSSFLFLSCSSPYFPLSFNHKPSWSEIRRPEHIVLMLFPQFLFPVVNNEPKIN